MIKCCEKQVLIRKLQQKGNIIRIIPKILCAYTLFQNGCQFSVFLFACKLALVASFKGKYSFEFRV